MTQTQLLAELTALFRDIFLRDDLVLRPDYTAANVPGWDSFKHVEIIMAVEEQYGIHLTTQEVDSLQSVGDLLTVIARKRA